MLITSRIALWSAGVERLDLDVLAPVHPLSSFLSAARSDAKRLTIPVGPRRSLANWTALRSAAEQAGAYVDALCFSFAEYLQQWEAKRPEVLAWHDLDLMKYPASVAITWETTFSQLPEPARQLLEVLSWLAPDPIPLFLFDAAPLVEAIPDPRGALASLRRFSLRGSTLWEMPSSFTGWCKRLPAVAFPRPERPTACESRSAPRTPWPQMTPTTYALGMSGPPWHLMRAWSAGSPMP